MKGSEVIDKVTSESVLTFFTNADPLNLLVFVIFVALVLFFFYKQNSNTKKVGDVLVDLEKALVIFKTSSDEKDSKYMSRIDSAVNIVIDNIKDIDRKLDNTNNTIDRLKDITLQHASVRCNNNGKGEIVIDFDRQKEGTV